jgi:25/26-hydroxycholesterol 7alpha-hydroxylase
MALLEFISSHQIWSIGIAFLLVAYAYHILLVTPEPSEPLLIKGYIPFLGVAPQAFLGLESYLKKCKAQYGDIFTLYAFGRRFTIVTDPVEGIPAIFRQPKQLSFKSMLRRVFIKGLGMTEERADHEALNKEHFGMITPYLLASQAVDELTGRFIRCLTKDIERDMEADGLTEGRVLDLFAWSSAKLFFASASALWGDDVFEKEGNEDLVDIYRTMDNNYHFLIALPLWMTKNIAKARNYVQEKLGTAFESGLKNPSSFAKKRIEVF